MEFTYDTDGNRPKLYSHMHVVQNSTGHMRYTARGRCTHIRHNEIRDTIANLINEVCHDVEIELKLRPLQGKS